MSSYFRLSLSFKRITSTSFSLRASHCVSARMMHSIGAQTATMDAIRVESPHREMQNPNYRSLALPESEDDIDIRQKYRPFILNEDAAEDWVNNLELTTVLDMAESDMQYTKKRLKVLVLYGNRGFQESD
ncbi:hypothetical protein VTN77DRAFT_9686 [Rasamsonia byssochlamydoides]|uniref:uncharacterized protein n=1 Tax=Rasamsonia byssochlamydoides TaxID=89139 RepID=UPI0037430644